MFLNNIANCDIDLEVYMKKTLFRYLFLYELTRNIKIVMENMFFFFII